MTQIKLRRDTAANFTSKNPVLGVGEPAYETDTKKLKIGDGTTAYTQLEYFSAGGGSSTDISATLPLKIVDGVISLEVDGQTIQIVDGKLTANSTAPTNMVTTDTAQTITGIKTFAGNFILDQRRVESGIQCIYTNNEGSIQTSTFIQPQNFSLGAGYATLNIGLSDVRMILHGSTIEDKSNKKFLTQGNVTAGDNITLERTEKGIKISSTSGGSSEPPANMVTTDTTQTITGIKKFKKFKSGDYSFNINQVDGIVGIVQGNDGVYDSRSLRLANNDPSAWAVGAQGKEGYIYGTKLTRNDGNSNQVILDAGNLGSYVDGTTITYTNNKLSATGGGSSEPPANMVTTDTSQDITAQKSFTTGKTIFKNQDSNRKILGEINSNGFYCNYYTNKASGEKPCYLGKVSQTVFNLGIPDATGTEGRIYATTLEKWQNTRYIGTILDSSNLGSYVDGTTITYANNKLSATGGAPVRYPVEVSDKSLMPSWYVVYNDGWCEQGGCSTISTTITLPKAYTNTNYTITIGTSETGSGTGLSNCVYWKKTASSFYFNKDYVTSDRNVGGCWQTCGYIN